MVHLRCVFDISFQMNHDETNLIDDQSFFFDQYSRGSHLGGFHRPKRNLEELHQALFHVKITLANEQNSFSSEENSRRSSSIKQISKKSSDDLILTNILRQSNIPILPETLVEELDEYLQLYAETSKKQSSSNSKFDRSSLFLTKNPSNDHLDEISKINLNDQVPKWSFSSQLIVQLHSTWNDLIKDTKYNYRVRSTNEDFPSSMD